MDRLTNFFKAISDETRLRIILLLFHEELCVCEIYGILDLPQPKVSKHLAKLRYMGLVKDKRKEQYVYYSLSINDKTLMEVVRNIVDRIENYKIALGDMNKLKDKGQYLQKCEILSELVQLR